MRFALLAVFALASSALAAPATSTGSCALQCTSPKSFAYQTGKSYVYDYSIDTSTALVGVADDDAKLRITAQANIDVTGPCDYILRVSNVNMEGSSHVSELAEALTKYSLKFSFQDGMIENICSDVSEPKWVLNIKRGLLSTFQNTMTYHEAENVQEMDISGVCKTHYKTVTEGDIVHVEKITDLSSCSLRPDFPSIISTSYSTDSPIQNFPLLKTVNKCRQDIQGGIIKGVECEEIYESRPFTSERGLAITKVKTTMILLSEDTILPIPEFEFYRQTLVYDDTVSDIPKIQIERVKEILSGLVVLSQDEIHAEFPAVFSELVNALKKLDHSQMSQLFSIAAEGLPRKFLVDAMPLVGTPEATVLVSKMILEKEMNAIEADIWFTSLAFYKNPAKQMISAIAPLLEQTPSQKALLGTSALINNYCKINVECETQPEIQNVIRLIENQIGAGCRTVSDEEKTKVLVALKALGNAGRWVNAKSTLQACYREENAMEIRVAALDAWRHTPCEYDRSDILRLFQDESFDPELRIAAYLSLMSCPTPTLINIVKERLTSEGVNQVGSFIWTHMTNMQESAAPEKEWMHEMIGEENLQKKFSTEALKFSRNYESSIFTNVLNVGASVESNIIFNSKSYLPRSGMLNLTMDLFGESINFLEVGGRIEGFEAYIERFFGSNGYFPEEHIEKVLKHMRSTSDAESTTLEGFLDKITDEPEGSYYLRVFGHELHYHHFNGLENLITSPGSKTPLDFLMDLIRKGNVDYTKSFQVMDSHLHIPTISGLPLILDSKVTGTIKLEMKGGFMAESMTNFKLEGRFHPSAALQVDGHMIIDANVAKAGVKLSSTLHSSTFIDGKIHIADSKLVDIAINTPKEKVEFIDVKGEYIYIIDSQEVKKEAGEQTVYEECSNGIIGMTLCGTLKNTPTTEIFPIGPFEAKMYLQKTDTQTGYIFHFMQDKEKMELVIDTPGSQKDNKFSMIITNSESAIEFDISTPMKSVKGSLEYIWTYTNKNIKGIMTMDNGEHYAVEAGLLKTVDEVTTYQPSLVITLPIGEVLNIKGISKTKLEYYDSIISTKIDVSYKWGSQQMIHLELDASKKLTESMSVFSLHGAIDPTQFAQLKSSVDVTLSDTENLQFKTQVKAVLNGQSYILEGMLQDNSAESNNIIADATLVSPSLEIKAGLGINYGSDTYSLDLKTAVNGQNYGLKIDLTKASLVIDANIIRHILLGAYLSSNEGVAKLHITCEWNKDVDPTAVFLFDGQISQDEVKVHVKLAEKEGNVLGKLLARGLELEGNWDDKKVTAVIGYTLGETKSLTISVQTPFTGFEKQDFTASITLKDNEISGRIVCTWQNTQQIALNLAGKLSPGLLKNALHTEVLFSSSFEGFEQLSFKLNHEMENLSIKSSIIASWDKMLLKSIFEVVPKPDGYESSLTVESPFSENLLITLNYVLNGKDITSIIEGKYGNTVATAALKGHIDLAHVHNVILSLQIALPSIPDITANINYKFDWAELQFIFEGVMGENKVMLNVNGDLVISPTTKFNGNLRFITPFTYPISATIVHANDGNSFESKLELTRFWSDYGTLKVHSEGHFLPADKLFLVELITPATKASVSLTHRISDQKLFSALDINLNGESLSVKVNGMLDLAKTEGNLELKIISTLKELNDIKLIIDTIKEDTKRTSKIILAKGEQSVTIDHILTATDTLNWENIVNINDQYKLRNTQVFTASLLAHEMECVWDQKTIHLTLQVDKKSSDNSQIIDGLISLVTPWTDNMKGEIHHENDGIEYNSVVTIEYAPGKKIELQNIIKTAKILYSKSILMTPFTETLGYEITVDLSSKKAVSLELSWGSKQITFDIAVEVITGKLDGSMKINSTYLDTPITADVAYDIISPTKSIYLLATYINKLEVKGLFSGDISKGDYSLLLNLPVEVFKHIELSGNWTFELGKASVDAKAIIDTLQDTMLHIDYDIQTQKEVSIKVAYGSKVIQLIAQLKEQVIALDLITPFKGWEHLKISIFLSGSAIDVTVSKNNLDLTIKGTFHIKSTKGKATLALTTPFENYEAISAELLYSLRGPIKYIEVKSSIPAGDLKLTGEIDVSKDLAPAIKLLFVSPFDVVKRIGGEASWDLRSDKKTAQVQVYKNDLLYQWELEVSIESAVAGYIKSKIVTPLPGMATVTVEGTLDFTKTPYEFKFALDKDGTLTKFEGIFNLSDKGFSCQLLTPFTGWEAIAITGKYDMVEDQVTGTFEISKDSDKYSLDADILFNMNTPKIHISMKTPIDFIANTELIFDSSLTEPQKTMHVILKVNDATFNLDVEGQIIHKTAYIKILARTPISGISIIDAQAKYDFTKQVKTAEIDFKIGNDSQRIYIETKVSKNRLQIQLQTPLIAFEMAKIVLDYNVQRNEYLASTSYIQGVEQFEYSLKVAMTEKSLDLALVTPTETLKTLTVSMNYELLENGVIAVLSAQKNEEKYEIKISGSFKPLESSLLVGIITPMEGWKSLTLDCKYDMISERKVAKFLIQKEELKKQVTIEGQFTPKAGFISIETPVEGFEVLASSYTLNIDEVNMNMDASIKIVKNSEEWAFSAQGQYSNNKMTIRFQTPFEDFKVIALDGEIDLEKKIANLVSELGSYKFTAKVSYAIDNLLIELTTPFDLLKILSVGFAFEISETQREATLNMVYNEEKYNVTGILILTPQISKISIEATTPFAGFKKVISSLKYDTTNKDELIFAELSLDQSEYSFKIGAQMSETVGTILCNFTSTLPGFTHVQLFANAQWNPEEKGFEVSLGKEDNLKAFDVIGKLSGFTEGSLIIRTPLTGMEEMGGQFKLVAWEKLEGSLDIVLPSTLVPKIHGNINLLLKDKILGEINLQIADESFSMKLDLVGKSLEDGYTGKIEIDTPIHVLSKVVLDGNLKLKTWTSLQTHLKAQLPSGTYEMDLKGDFVLRNSAFLFNLETTIMGINRKVTLESKYASLNDLEMLVAIVLDDQSHKIFGKLNAASNSISSNISIESTLIEGKKEISFVISLPTSSRKHLSCIITVITGLKHSMSVDIDFTNEVEASLLIDSPIFPKIAAMLKINTEAASLSIETPQGNHLLTLSWQILPGDYAFTAQLMSPLLPDTYSVNILLKSEKNNLKFKSELAVGSVQHIIEGSVSVTESSADISLGIETPFMNIGKATLAVSLKFAASVEMNITASIKDQTNTFDLVYDEDNRSFIVQVTSPLIPTGMAKCEGKIIGDTTKDMKMKITLQNSEKTISGVLHVKVLNGDNMKTELIITTPFKGFRKMKFGAEYVKNEDTAVIFFIEKPIKGLAKLLIRSTEKELMTSLNVETSTQLVKKIMAEVKIPFTAIAPRMSTEAVINGLFYGGNLSFRMTPPYELGVAYNLADKSTGYFHIRTDSSFFSLLL
ncbi:LOW QUALITY PROTEIN: uncharacterized protein [Palaemon carinicauda]|uniref:LOW QUALITY PROTEIN: uncharacterized protein n=1 Tax=Palaemon carinicauda TaxID=392227 RepID=UPI0035B68AB2